MVVLTIGKRRHAVLIFLGQGWWSPKQTMVMGMLCFRFIHNVFTSMLAVCVHVHMATVLLCGHVVRFQRPDEVFTVHVGAARGGVFGTQGRKQTLRVRRSNSHACQLRAPKKLCHIDRFVLVDRKDFFQFHRVLGVQIHNALLGHQLIPFFFLQHVGRVGHRHHGRSTSTLPRFFHHRVFQQFPVVFVARDRVPTAQMANPSFFVFGGFF